MLGDAEPAHSLNDDEATIDVGDVDAYCYCVSVIAVEETSCLLLFIDRRSRTKTATQSKLLMLSSGCCISGIKFSHEYFSILCHILSFQKLLYAFWRFNKKQSLGQFRRKQATSLTIKKLFT